MVNVPTGLNGKSGTDRAQTSTDFLILAFGINATSPKLIFIRAVNNSATYDNIRVGYTLTAGSNIFYYTTANSNNYSGTITATYYEQSNYTEIHLKPLSGYPFQTGIDYEWFVVA